jgi:hypothetical protein
LIVVVTSAESGVGAIASAGRDTEKAEPANAAKAKKYFMLRYDLLAKSGLFNSHIENEKL